MDKMNPILQPDLESSLNQFYTAQQPAAAFSSQLEAQLRHRQMELISPDREPHSSRSGLKVLFTQTFRKRRVLVPLLVILALLAITGMVYALGGLRGFIPGFGFTSDRNPVYLLDEPVEMTSGGVNFRVKQAVNDGERFWVEMTVTGLPDQVHFSDVYVLLPDGEKIQWQLGADTMDQGEISYRVQFPPLNDQPSEVTLFVEYLTGQSISLPIKLRPAEPGDIVPPQPEGFEVMQSET